MDQEQPQQFFAYTAQSGAGHVPGYDPTAAASMGIPSLGPLNMLVQPLLQGLAAQQGMFLGQMNPNVNVADMLQADMSRRQLMREMATSMHDTDVKSWLKTTEGLVRMSGASYGLEQQAGFMQAYRNMAPILSVLAQTSPEIIDQLHGPQGSAAVMSMGLFRGGQYRAGTLSGIPGLRGDDLQELAKGIQEHLYSTPEKIEQMQGVGMGQIGKIFDEAQRRGYMASSLSVRSKDSQIDAISKETKDTRQELEQLNDADFGQKLREFDSKKVSGRLKELAGSITAMRDLFGSMGQGGAPISQLVNALEALTQNRLANMPAGAVEQIVRKTKALMETTGANLDSIVGLAAIAGNYGDKIGLDRTLAIQSAHHAVAYESAYKQAFGSDFKGFGALSPDQLGQQEAIRSQRAAGSEQAQFAGAVVRTAKLFKLDETSRAGRLAEAIKRGDAEFEGESMYKVLRRDTLQTIMADAGPNAHTILPAFNQAMNDKFSNQETILEHDIGGKVRRLQSQDIVYGSRHAGETGVTQALVDLGVDKATAVKEGRAIGPEFLRRMLNSDNPEQLSNEEGRAKMIQDVLTEQYGAKKAAIMTPGVALMFESQMSYYTRMKGLGNISQLIQTQNATVLKQEAQVQRMTHADAEIDKALSPLGRAGPVARIISLIQQQKSDTEIGKTLGAAANGIPVEKIRALMADTDTIKRLGTAETLSPEDRKVLNVARERVTDTVKHLVSQGNAQGLDVARTVDDKHVSNLLRSAKDVTAAMAEKDPEKRRKMTSQAIERGMVRTKEFVQTMYLDDASLRKLGPGGVAKVAALEHKYTQLVRLTGGDGTMIAKALSGDASVPAALRKQIVTLHQQMEHASQDLGNKLLGTGKLMTADEFAGGAKAVALNAVHAKEKALSTLTGGSKARLAQALAGDASVPEEDRAKIVALDREIKADRVKLAAMPLSEKEQVEQIRKLRTTDDTTQTRSILDNLAAIGGINPKDMTEAQHKELRLAMGAFGTTQRNGILTAVAARQRLDTAASKAGITVAQLRARGRSEQDFDQAGPLGNFAVDGKGDDIHKLQEIMQEFEPPDASAKAGAGATEMHITGRLNLESGEMAATGFTNLGMQS
jgi:hypothetical protein